MRPVRPLQNWPALLERLGLDPAQRPVMAFVLENAPEEWLALQGITPSFIAGSVPANGGGNFSELYFYNTPDGESTVTVEQVILRNATAADHHVWIAVQRGAPPQGFVQGTTLGTSRDTRLPLRTNALVTWTKNAGAVASGVDRFGVSVKANDVRMLSVRYVFQPNNGLVVAAQAANQEVSAVVITRERLVADELDVRT